MEIKEGGISTSLACTKAKMHFFFSVGLGLKVAQVCASLNKMNQGSIKKLLSPG